MNLPFNSQLPQFITRVKTYCAKVLPLVFDNSLSYYETLCAFLHKLNELIDALNAQNLNIIEFTHMVSLEIETFEKYVDNRVTEFETIVNAKIEEFETTVTNELNQFKTEWVQFKTELNTNLETWQNETINNFNQSIINWENSATENLNLELNKIRELVSKEIANLKIKDNDLQSQIDAIKENGNSTITIDSQLSLTSKNPVENQVITRKLNEVFTSVSNGKNLIASAITDKGIKTEPDATFQEMANNIELINGGYGSLGYPLGISTYVIKSIGLNPICLTGISSFAINSIGLNKYKIGISEVQT